MNNKLIEIIKSVCEKSVEIDEFTSLSKDLSFTSIHFVQLIVEIESVFEFEFDDADLDLNKLDCVGDLNRVVCSHI